MFEVNTMTPVCSTDYPLIISYIWIFDVLLYMFILQDLIPVKFTPVADRDDKTSLIAKGVSENLYNYVL